MLVAAGGAVTVTNGLTMSEAQELFRLMLRDSLAGIQAEAYETAERRNEKLLADFLAQAEKRFGAEVEEKLAGFRDPGAQFALRYAQAEYCKYGSESGEADAIELLISRLDDGGQFSHTVVIDEAIKLCGRLSSRQVDLACLLHMIFRTAFNGIGSDNALGEFLRAAMRYADGVNCSRSELAMLAHSGVIQQFTQTKHWLPIPQVLKNHYPGLFLRGESIDYFGLPENIKPKVLSRHIRSSDKVQPNHVSLNQWESDLVGQGMTVDEARAAREKANNLLLPDNEVMEIAISHAPEIANVLPKFQNESSSEAPELCNYDLAPIGRALALARTRRDGWRPDSSLAALL